MKKGVFILIIIVSLFVFISSCTMGGTRTSSSFPKTYNDAYKEYQNGNKAPLEGYYKWLENNP